MSIAQNLKETRKTPRCPVGRLLDSLDSVDRVALEEAMADSLVSNSTIVTAVRRENLVLDRNALSAHRRRECRCE